MVTVLRAGGFAIRIYKDDHPPAHVHVVGDGIAKINLMGADGPELVWAKGMTKAQVRRAVALVDENRIALLSEWRAIHGE